MLIEMQFPSKYNQNNKKTKGRRQLSGRVLCSYFYLRERTLFETPVRNLINPYKNNPDRKYRKLSIRTLLYVLISARKCRLHNLFGGDKYLRDERMPAGTITRHETALRLCCDIPLETRFQNLIYKPSSVYIECGFKGLSNVTEIAPFRFKIIRGDNPTSY